MLDPSRRKKLTDLFAEAAELAAEARSAFVLDSCADDPDLLRELATLVRGLSRVDDFLARPLELGASDGQPATQPLPRATEGGS